jgi:hypothetical protein
VRKLADDPTQFDAASLGGTEAINELVGLHRRVVRGFRNRGNYRHACS